MVKKAHEGSERSRVRIFFVEGDFAPGDLRELTQALGSAIAPSGGKRPVGRLPAVVPLETEALETLVTEDSEAADAVEEEPEADERPARGAGKVRSYRKPQPVDLDMKGGGKAFAEFAAQKKPTAHRGKYLVAAAWLHDVAKVASPTADHIFTCYKAAGWTFDIGDPTVTFRSLKAEGLGTLKRGSFSINHLGLAEVEKMNT
jgi:hypothetical protein